MWRNTFLLEEFISPSIEYVTCVEDIGDDWFKEAFALNKLMDIPQLFHCVSPDYADKLIREVAVGP